MSFASKIASKIEARKAARELYESLICEEAERIDEPQRAFFWGLLVDLVAQNVVPKPEPRTGPMTDEQAILFEKNVATPWGEHKGRRVSDVPLEYLVWLATQPQEFARDLNRYLASPRMQRQQD